MKPACWLRWKLLPLIYWLTDVLSQLPRCRRCPTCKRCTWHGKACVHVGPQDEPEEVPF